jgi:hypothetical protein
VLVGIASKPKATTTSARETVTVVAPASNGTAPTGTTQPTQAAGPATTMGSGVYQVGVDVQAGRYKTPGPPEGDVLGMCSWTRNKDDSGETESTISGGMLQGPGSVTINEGEFIELIGSCEWTRVA